MEGVMRVALVTLALSCSLVRAQDAGTESREGKAIGQLNTVIVGPDHFEPISATPRVTATRLTVSSEPSIAEVVTASSGYSTKTIYGFLDFITTVGDTVMVFTPTSRTKGGNKKPPSTALAQRQNDIIREQITQTVPKSVTTFTLDVTSEVPATSEEEQPTESPKPVDVETLFSTPSTISLESSFERAGNNLLWAKLRERKPTEKRPFLLPQRRPQRQRSPRPSTLVPILVEGTGTPVIRVPPETQVTLTHSVGYRVRQPTGDAAETTVETPSIADQYRQRLLSAQTAAIPQRLVLSTVIQSPTGLVTTLGGTDIRGHLTTVHTTSVIGTFVNGQYAQVLHSSSVIFSAPISTPAVVSRASSVVQGAVTEYPGRSQPALEPEVLPLERLFSSLDGDEPQSEVRDPAGQKEGSLRERLQARLKAALESRPSREAAPPAETRPRPFTLSYEPRPPTARTARRPGPRPEIPLPPRRSYSGRQGGKRAPSAAERLKKLLLQQRQEHNLDEKQPGEEVSTARNTPEAFSYGYNNGEDLYEDQVTEASVTTPVSRDDIRVIRVNTYKPTDASDHYFLVSTLKTMKHITIGRYTNSRWFTQTTTETITIQQTAPPPGPTVAPSRTAAPLATTEAPFVNLLGPARPESEAVILPAVRLDPSSPSLPLRTMTETFSTTELVLKSSVIPLVIGANTQPFTVTQSYRVTRMVTAVKTVPPMEMFHGHNGLLESNSTLEGQYSENQVDEDGVPVQRLPPPDNLADIGGSFDPDAMEKHTNPQLHALGHGTQTATPSLPAPLGGLGHLGGLNAQQLLYLQLLAPYLGMGLPGAQQPNTVVNSSPVVISTTVTSTRSTAVVVTFQNQPSTAFITSTNIIPTVITSYVTSTTVVPGAQLPLFG